MTADVCDIAIVGAGAAGLAAAIFAGERGGGRRIVLLDGAKTIGAKILVSGGGRCNVTHERVRAEDFNHGGPAHPVRHVLKAFDEHKAAAWFRSMGVALKREETGKLFPVSDSARTVLGALMARCSILGVGVRTGCRVQQIRRCVDKPGYEVVYEGGTLAARRVVLATGGRSLPRTGSDGYGYTIARSLGHSVTRTAPALAPLVLGEVMFHAQVSGVATRATLSTFVSGKRIDRRTGSLLWTHFGVSGPVAMDASRHWTMARELGQPASMRCAVLPEMEFAGVERWFVERASAQPRQSVARVLGEKVPARLAEALGVYAGIESTAMVGQVRKEDRRRLVHALTDLELPVLRDRGWNYAEVTAGGVPLGEVDPSTMESQCSPGLYLVGEILDVDGRIGGFNFQWAWSTGFVAGRAAGSEG